MSTKAGSVTQADRVLVWLKVLTILLGGAGTIAVVFLADVMTAKLANPVGVAGIDAVKMTEYEELHYWLGYKLGVMAQDDKDVVFHVQKGFAVAQDPKQKSALDGVLVEHMPAGHFIHTKNIIKELLGTKPEPSAIPIQLEARLALLLVKENKIAEAKEQLNHMLSVPTVTGKEVVQGIVEALDKGDLDSAGQRLMALASGQ